MKFKSLAVLILAGTIVNSAVADTTLPFIGTKHFNFAGGSGTERSITIKKDGTAIVKLNGVISTGVEYKGKFKNPLQIDKEERYYYFFSKNQVEMLDEHKKPLYKCSPSNPNDPTSTIVLDDEGNTKCTQKLY